MYFYFHLLRDSVPLIHGILKILYKGHSENPFIRTEEILNLAFILASAKGWWFEPIRGLNLVFINLKQEQKEDVYKTFFCL